MSRENPLWGAPRIHGELLKLGIDIGETSVGKYMVRGRKPPSQTWRTFLENHFESFFRVERRPTFRRAAAIRRLAAADMLRFDRPAPSTAGAAT